MKSPNRSNVVIRVPVVKGNNLLRLVENTGNLAGVFYLLYKGCILFCAFPSYEK